MEALAAAAAAKEAASAACIAAAAAATAKEAAIEASAAALNAKEAATTASAAALIAKEAAVAASAAALNSKEAAATAAAVAASAAALNSKESAAAKEAAAAAVQASNKKRKFHVMDDGQDPPGNANVDVESVDFINRLPDAVLGIIVSFLPTKDGARTQSISRRWRPLWRSAPLNLAGSIFCRQGRVTVELIPKILAEHPGPARRLSLDIFIRDCYNKIEGWLGSQALDNLQELELTFQYWWRDKQKRPHPLPLSMYRFAPTLRVAKFSRCHFPELIGQPSLQFPYLKQLTLESGTISEHALQSMLSGCHALESLELKNNVGFGRLCISSQTLKSIGFCAGFRSDGVLLQELVIEDSPCLERLLPLQSKVGPATVRVISSHKLKILGMLSKDIVELQFGTTVFKKMIAVGLTNKMHTVKVLVLDPAGLYLDTVVSFLKCFPCLEKLYVIFKSGMAMNNAHQYDPLDPIECLELHLKEVVMKNYDGLDMSCIDFGKFFVLNAKVLKEMKMALPYHRQHKWIANQRRLLQIENRASRDARIELTCGSNTCGSNDYFTHNARTHCLSIADPFDMPSIGCSKCR